MTVTLTNDDLIYAAHVGMLRHIRNIRNNRLPTRGREYDDWNGHMDGTCAEYAAQKACGIFQPLKIIDDKRGDFTIGDSICEVRNTKYKDGRLIVNPDERNESYFILVTGYAPTFNVVGWLQGIHAKDQQHWKSLDKNRGNTFAVDQEYLHDIEKLKTIILAYT